MRKAQLFLGVGLLSLLVAISIYTYTHANGEEIDQRINDSCPYMFVSWNLENFGRKKTDEAIEEIAETVCREADIIAVQEVVTGKDFGAQAVAKLAVACSRKGKAWGYITSNPTSPKNSETESYAFLYNKSVVSINQKQPHLVQELEEAISREPYTAIFQLKQGQAVNVYTIHAVPTAKSPINEVRALESSQELQDVPRAIFSGDFNLGKRDTDPSFKKLGFIGHIDEPTSLKNKVEGEVYKEKQYDNIYTKGMNVCSSGVIDFVKKSYSPVTTESMKRAKLVSDHLPVYIRFE